MVQAVAEKGVDVVICWSLCLETFCFTVHEALAGGAFVVACKGAGNIWPAVELNAPDQGCAVEDEASLFQLFETGEILVRVAQARRCSGTLSPSGNTADFLLKDRIAATALSDMYEVH